MPLTRRHLLISTAATAAVAAMPAASAIASVETAPVVAHTDLARQYELAEAIDAAITPAYRAAWGRAVRSAWLGSGGTDEGFRKSFPQDAAAIDAEEENELSELTDEDLEEMAKPLPRGSDDYELDDLDDDGKRIQ